MPIQHIQQCHGPECGHSFGRSWYRVGADSGCGPEPQLSQISWNPNSLPDIQVSHTSVLPARFSLRLRNVDCLRAGRVPSGRGIISPLYWLQRRCIIFRLSSFQVPPCASGCQWSMVGALGPSSILKSSTSSQSGYMQKSPSLFRRNAIRSSLEGAL